MYTEKKLLVVDDNLIKKKNSRSSMTALLLWNMKYRFWLPPDRRCGGIFGVLIFLMRRENPSRPSVRPRILKN